MTEPQRPLTPPPELVQPNNTQLNGIIYGLEHCFTNESKREYLKTWIGEWTIDKINRAARHTTDLEMNTIRRALERLQQLEDQQ